MKTINLSSVLPELTNCNTKNIYDPSQEITKRLLEKYKPKGRHKTNKMARKNSEEVNLKS